MSAYGLKTSDYVDFASAAEFESSPGLDHHTEVASAHEAASGWAYKVRAARLEQPCRARGAHSQRATKPPPPLGALEGRGVPLRRTQRTRGHAHAGVTHWALRLGRARARPARRPAERARGGRRALRLGLGHVWAGTRPS